MLGARQLSPRMAAVGYMLRHPYATEQRLPSHLRPVFRAYILGYISSILPQILTLIVTLRAKRCKARESGGTFNFVATLTKILRTSLEWQRFPFFCAVLAGGSSIFVYPASTILSEFGSTRIRVQSQIAHFLSAFVAAWLSLKILQSKQSDAFIDRVPCSTSSEENVITGEIHFAGRTIDLTLFALTRAVDAVISKLWARRKARKLQASTWAWYDIMISKQAESSVFASSCALILWAWVYVPERLPKAYNKWITSAAGIDSRLTALLRKASWGEFVYGTDTGPDSLIESMCRDYSWPLVWADPAKTIPVPCEMVHLGTGPANFQSVISHDLHSWRARSCEYNAWNKFKRSFFFGCGIYIPLNLILLIRDPSRTGLNKALRSSIRSSAGLGSLIALFYYGVCLARSRIGPKLLGTTTKARQRIDSGLCVASGCALCGWSILIESAARRRDMALFVAPRALAVLLPRRYSLRYQYRENLVFALSIATLFTLLRQDPKSIRGGLGRVLSSVMLP